jgi:hypothetical protein
VDLARQVEVPAFLAHSPGAYLAAVALSSGVVVRGSAGCRGGLAVRRRTRLLDPLLEWAVGAAAAAA